MLTILQVITQAWRPTPAAPSRTGTLRTRLTGLTRPSVTRQIAAHLEFTWPNRHVITMCVRMVEQMRHTNQWRHGIRKTELDIITLRARLLDLRFRLQDLRVGRSATMAIRCLIIRCQLGRPGLIQGADRFIKPENSDLRVTSLYNWPPVYFVWIQLFCLSCINNSFTCLVKSKPVNQEVSHTVILPPSVLWLNLFICIILIFSLLVLAFSIRPIPIRRWAKTYYCPFWSSSNEKQLCLIFHHSFHD